jgi:catechol 2,3-dioxygenase
VSAGGYHHHVAYNIWRGHEVPPAPADAVGLRHYNVILPTPADVAAVRGRSESAGITAELRDDGLLVHDPSGNALLISPDPARAQTDL